MYERDRGIKVVPTCHYLDSPLSFAAKAEAIRELVGESENLKSSKNCCDLQV
jgi:hypothetical protein